MFVAVSFASGTKAPDASTTVPRILAYRLAAYAGVVQTTIPHTNPSARQKAKKQNVCCFITSPPYLEFSIAARKSNAVLPRDKTGSSLSRVRDPETPKKAIKTVNST